MYIRNLAFSHLKTSRIIHWRQINNIFHTSKDVEYYNDLILHKKFPANQIYVIQLETNVRNVEHIQPWVNNKRFNHMQHVALGTLVMLIENIDFKVGVANGTIGIITKLEFDLKYNVYSNFIALNPSG